jgi:hypothetical protein
MLTVFVGYQTHPLNIGMAGLVPAIHGFLSSLAKPSFR